jgi:hypothetical protein
VDGSLPFSVDSVGELLLWIALGAIAWITGAWWVFLLGIPLAMWGVWRRSRLAKDRQRDGQEMLR